MRGALGIGRMQLGLGGIGLQDGRFEIIDDEALGRAAEKGKRLPMQINPGGNLLVKDQLDILVAASRKRHDKRPAFALLPCGRIHLSAGIAKIDLGFLSGRRLDAHRHLGHDPLALADKTIDRCITARVALIA